LQRRSANQAEPEEVPPIVHEVLRSPGQPLDAKTGRLMELRFSDEFNREKIHASNRSLTPSILTISPTGDSYEQEADRVAAGVMQTAESSTVKRASTPTKYDFSQVRVHTNARAAESAQAVNALAYTVGHDVVFGLGQYKPGSEVGQQLLAHELTHVIQQTRDGTGHRCATLLQPKEAPTSEPSSVINPKIDVRAQFALLRLLKGSAEDAQEAKDLINDVNSDKIKGIYGDDLAVAAVIAGERGKTRWQLVPKDRDAAWLEDEFSDTPVIIFRESAGHKPVLDRALLNVYREHKGDAPAIDPPKQVPPSFKLPPKPKPASPSCQYQIVETLPSKVKCANNACGGGITYDITAVIATGAGCPPTLEGKMYTESITSNSGCISVAPIAGAGCPIGPGGTISACRDTYRLCFPKDLVTRLGYPPLPCIQTMTQKLFIDGVLAKTRVINFFIDKPKLDINASEGMTCDAEVTISN
jgi:hypothetical protein